MERKNPKIIALVACVSKKVDKPMQAQQLYISDWFIKASAYAKSISDNWYILSAKYGLVSPDAVIDPYDETLNNMSVSERKDWSLWVMQNLSPEVVPGDHVVFLAGKKYREFLVQPLRSLGCYVEIPMEGLRIGEQLNWLSQRLTV